MFKGQVIFRWRNPSPPPNTVRVYIPVSGRDPLRRNGKYRFLHLVQNLGSLVLEQIDKDEKFEPLASRMEKMLDENSKSDGQLSSGTSPETKSNSQDSSLEQKKVKKKFIKCVNDSVIKEKTNRTKTKNNCLQKEVSRSNLKPKSIRSKNSSSPEVVYQYRHLSSRLAPLKLRSPSRSPLRSKSPQLREKLARFHPRFRLRSTSPALRRSRFHHSRSRSRSRSPRRRSPRRRSSRSPQGRRTRLTFYNSRSPSTARKKSITSPGSNPTNQGNKTLPEQMLEKKTKKAVKLEKIMAKFTLKNDNAEKDQTRPKPSSVQPSVCPKLNMELITEPGEIVESFTKVTSLPCKNSQVEKKQQSVKIKESVIPTSNFTSVQDEKKPFPGIKFKIKKVKSLPCMNSQVEEKQQTVKFEKNATPTSNFTSVQDGKKHFTEITFHRIQSFTNVTSLPCKTSQEKKQQTVEFEKNATPTSNFTSVQDEGIIPFKQEDYDTEDFQEYYCKDCNAEMNSLSSWESHIAGKRHMKNSKMPSEEPPEALMNEPFLFKAEPPELDRPILKAEKEPSKCPPVGPNCKRKTIAGERPFIQNEIDQLQVCPGLDEVTEIRMTEDIRYFCNLCNAPCDSAGIIPHVTGIRHHMRCLRVNNPALHDKYSNIPVAQVKAKVRQYLLDIERREGRRAILVQKDFLEPGAVLDSDEVPPIPPKTCKSKFRNADLSGPGCSNTPVMCIEPDTSKADFYCRPCNAHMGNETMWLAHVKGKRHAKAMKKQPGEVTSKTVRSLTAVSQLETMLRESGNIVVGLDFVRETQHLSGVQYNCYLCGGCYTNHDIQDHLLSTKHGKKVLEKQDLTTNKYLQQLKHLSGFALESLIQEKVYDWHALHGPGTVEVYVPSG